MKYWINFFLNGDINNGMNKNDYFVFDKDYIWFIYSLVKRDKKERKKFFFLLKPVFPL